MPTTGKSRKVALGFRHTGVVVRDMEKALWFYRDLLGLEPVKDYVEEGPFMDGLTQMPDVRVRIAKLQIENGGMIELLQFLSHPVEFPPPDLPKTRIAHVAFTVENIDALHRDWLTQGIRFNCAPQLSPDGYAKVTYCKDLMARSLN